MSRAELVVVLEEAGLERGRGHHRFLQLQVVQVCRQRTGSGSRRFQFSPAVIVVAEVERLMQFGIAGRPLYFKAKQFPMDVHSKIRDCRYSALFNILIKDSIQGTTNETERTEYPEGKGEIDQSWSSQPGSRHHTSGRGENRFNNHEVIRQIAGVSRRRTRLRGSKSLKRHGGSGLKPEFHSIIKK
jgi:hypothetical protein